MGNLSRTFDLTIGIGGESGQGVASFVYLIAQALRRHGLFTFEHFAYQNIIRGGHSLVTLRFSEQPVHCESEKLDVLLALNQDTLDRHILLLKTDGAVIYDIERATLPIGHRAKGFGLPIKTLSESVMPDLGKLAGNQIFAGALYQVLGFEFSTLEEQIDLLWARRAADLIQRQKDLATVGFTFARNEFTTLLRLPSKGEPLARFFGNNAFALGAIAAGVKFYAAYPAVPASGILTAMARIAKKCEVVVIQAEDDIAAACMTIGAAHAGCRAMCATAGGGFALMSEAIGMSAMMEVPIVCIKVQRAGPANALATKTEQGDLWEVLGAGQGDYPKIVVAPTTVLDAFKTVPELFNLTDQFQCPGIILSDQYISEGCTYSVRPEEINFDVSINRGALIRAENSKLVLNPHGGASDKTYLRYKHTESGISPRASPGLPGYVHVVSTDEHDEDGTLISDEFTNPHKRRAMHEKRMRKLEGILALLEPPKLMGPIEAQFTLLGWGSTQPNIADAAERLCAVGIPTNHLQVKWLVPLHGEVIMSLIGSAKVVIVEQNISGQFARYLRSETGYSAYAHIRKYDGEPFLPRHIVDGVREILANGPRIYIPVENRNL